VLDCRLHGVSRDLAQLRVGCRVHHVCLRYVVRFHIGLKEVNEEWSEAGAVSVIGGGGRFLQIPATPQFQHDQRNSSRDGEVFLAGVEIPFDRC
jgi:hypothetical protein